MKNIKDITISIFAIIGFVVILSSFTTNNIQEETNEADYAVHKSHVWHLSTDGEDAYIYNQVSGEVRILSGQHPKKYGTYVTLKEGD